MEIRLGRFLFSFHFANSELKGSGCVSLQFLGSFLNISSTELRMDSPNITISLLHRCWWFRLFIFRYFRRECWWFRLFIFRYSGECVDGFEYLFLLFQERVLMVSAFYFSLFRRVCWWLWIFIFVISGECVDGFEFLFFVISGECVDGFGFSFFVISGECVDWWFWLFITHYFRRVLMALAFHFSLFQARVLMVWLFITHYFRRECWWFWLFISRYFRRECL